MAVRDGPGWPLESMRWTPLHLTSTGLSLDSATEPGSISFDTRSRGVRFGWTCPDDVELTGPMALRLFVEVAGHHDVDLIVGEDPLRAGEVVQVDIPLGPSATLFRAGEQLRLVVAGRWLWSRNPLNGQFPAGYQSLSRGRCTVRWGPDRAARLLMPVID